MEFKEEFFRIDTEVDKFRKRTMIQVTHVPSGLSALGEYMNDILPEIVQTKECFEGQIASQLKDSLIKKLQS